VWEVSSTEFKIMDYGAVKSLENESTEAIRKAINAASEARGDTVRDAAGHFLTGTIHLKSNLTLYAEGGAYVNFSTDFDDYLPMVPSRLESAEKVNFSPFLTLTPLYCDKVSIRAFSIQNDEDSFNRDGINPDSCRNVGTDQEPVSERMPVFRNIRINGLTGDAKMAGELIALQELPLQGLSFTDIRLDTQVRFTMSDVNDVELRNVIVNTQEGPAFRTERGAHPIMANPVVHRYFTEDGALQNTHGKYPEAARKLAVEMNLPLLEMTSTFRDLLTQLGKERSKRLFIWTRPGEYERFPDGNKDNTHFNALGATRMCDLAVNEMRKNIPELARHLKGKP
jgi:hypothetical protein